MADTVVRPLTLDEFKAFSSACRKHGRAPDEFTVSATRAGPQEGDATRISIQFNQTGMRHDYPVDGNICWAAAFDGDLEQGLFWDGAD
jgi:hypothetical protein